MPVYLYLAVSGNIVYVSRHASRFVRAVKKSRGVVAARVVYSPRTTPWRTSHAHVLCRRAKEAGAPTPSRHDQAPPQIAVAMPSEDYII